MKRMLAIALIGSACLFGAANAQADCWKRVVIGPNMRWQVVKVCHYNGGGYWHRHNWWRGHWHRNQQHHHDHRVWR